MPVGVPLVDLRTDLRSETGQTLNPLQMVQAQVAQDMMLNRQQRELWDAYTWPHLSFYVDLPAEVGQYLYAFPDTMPFDQVKNVYWVSGGAHWERLEYGIRAYDTPPRVMINPLVVLPEPGSEFYPVLKGRPARWMNRVAIGDDGKTNPAGALEILPAPDVRGVLRLEGQAPLTKMVDDDDKCLLDSDAIVLFAAAEILATTKAEVAQLKLTKAQGHLRRLQINNGADKRRNYSMGSSYGTSRRSSNGAVPYIDYIP